MAQNESVLYSAMPQHTLTYVYRGSLMINFIAWSHVELEGMSCMVCVHVCVCMDVYVRTHACGCFEIDWGYKHARKKITHTVTKMSY